MEWKKDCRSFLGNYACDTLKSEDYKDCSECKFYDKVEKKILIIKLGARGDVLRTTTILRAIKRKYKNCSITWLVDKDCKEILKNNNLIDRVLIYNLDTVLRLKCEKFDVLFSLEVDVPGIGLANFIKAKKKYGYYLEKDGFPKSFKKSGNYYLKRVFSDYINRNNTKTYQKMFFDICELEYDNEKYVLNLSLRSKEYAEMFKSKLKDKKTIGINIGSGGRFPSRMISNESLVELVKELNKKYNVILLGGPNEKENKEKLAKKLKVSENDSDNSVEEFIGVLNLCDVIIAGDTMALHLALGLDKKIVGLFFCTPPNEIEDYGLVTKLVSPLLYDHFYTDEYSEELVDSISVKDIISAVYKNL